MSALSFRPESIGAIRLLSSMAIFAFTSFIAVDPYMIEGSIAALVQVRVVWILGACLLLWSTWTRIALRHATTIGMILCVWTGSGVVLLTEMTGGASSPYWTMVMLTFFAVALVLPMKAWQAALSFGAVAVFYYAWMMGHCNGFQLHLQSVGNGCSGPAVASPFSACRYAVTPGNLNQQPCKSRTGEDSKGRSSNAAAGCGGTAGLRHGP